MRRQASGARLTCSDLYVECLHATNRNRGGKKWGKVARPAALARRSCRERFAIVTCRFHAVIAAQRLVTARLVVPHVVGEIAEGGRQAVAAMLQRRSAKRPQRILQPCGQ